MAANHPGNFTVGTPQFSSQGPNGTIQALSVNGSQRSMKAFTITELELSQLSSSGQVETTATSFAWSLWAFAVGLIVQAVFSDFNKIPELAKALCYVAIPITLTLGSACFLIGLHFAKKAKSIQDTIKTETTHNP